MTILAQPHTDSVRGRQLTAALALAKILEHDLPDAAWNLSNGDPSLDGQIRADDDDTARAHIADWAQFLGGSAEEDRPFTSSIGTTFTHLGVAGTYRGVPVRVWTHVNVSGEE